MTRRPTKHHYCDNTQREKLNWWDESEEKQDLIQDHVTIQFTVDNLFSMATEKIEQDEKDESFSNLGLNTFWFLHREKNIVLELELIKLSRRWISTSRWIV